jgi:hypothetical protein
MLDIPRFDRPSRRFCMPQSHEPFVAFLAELPTCRVWLDMRSTFSSISQAARAGGGNDHDRPERELSADVLSESAPIPGSSVAQANSSKGQGTGPWDAFICTRTTVCCTHTACKLQHSGCQSPQMQTSHMSSWQYCSPRGSLVVRASSNVRAGQLSQPLQVFDLAPTPLSEAQTDAAPASAHYKNLIA